MESLSKYCMHSSIYASCSCKCAGKFHVAQAKLNHGGNDDAEHDDLIENNSRNHGESNQVHEVIDEEISSPAWYVVCFDPDVMIDNGRHSQAGGKMINSDSDGGKGPQNDNGIQFFCRIRVVCMNLTGQVRLLYFPKGPLADNQS